MKIRILAAACALFAGTMAVQAQLPGLHLAPGTTVSNLATDPFLDENFVIEGAGAERAHFQLDRPVWSGDWPGSLSVLYRSDMEAGRLGWRLDEPLTQDDGFIAAAVIAFDPNHFNADPYGYFQLSWGLWNSETTGMDRTGSPTPTVADTFEMLEFDYFPQVSPWFGGPWLSPSAFGIADETNPLFPSSGAFANFASGNSLVELPLGRPLLMVIEHEPSKDRAHFQVYEITKCGRIIPLKGAEADVSLSALGLREYSFDTIGLTLWNDGWGGETPALDARVSLHKLILRRGQLLFKPSDVGFRPAARHSTRRFVIHH